MENKKGSVRFSLSRKRNQPAGAGNGLDAGPNVFKTELKKRHRHHEKAGNRSSLHSEPQRGLSELTVDDGVRVVDGDDFDERPLFLLDGGVSMPDGTELVGLGNGTVSVNLLWADSCFIEKKSTLNTIDS